MSEVKYKEFEQSYVSIKFATGQDIIGFLISCNDDTTISFKRLMYVLPSQVTEGQMDLSPFLGFVDVEDEHAFERQHIMNVGKPDDKIINMMTQSFSKIVQPVAEASNVSKLILS